MRYYFGDEDCIREVTSKNINDVIDKLEEFRSNKMCECAEHFNNKVISIRTKGLVDNKEDIFYLYLYDMLTQVKDKDTEVTEETIKMCFSTAIKNIADYCNMRVKDVSKELFSNDTEKSEKLIGYTYNLIKSNGEDTSIFDCYMISAYNSDRLDIVESKQLILEYLKI